MSRDLPPALRPAPTPSVPRFGLRPAEAAEAIGVSERHLRSLADGPPVARLGTAVVYPCDLLAAWLRDRALIGEPPAIAVAAEVCVAAE